MMNWPGAAFKTAETDFNLGRDIMNITSNLLSSKGRQLSLEIQKRNAERQAEAAMQTAGNIQTNARQQAEMRLQELGQDKGRIVASAAGSGLDVSSVSVSKTIADTAKSAWNDVAAINRNAKSEGQSAMNAWLSAKTDAAAAAFAGTQERKNAKWQLWSGVLQAGANWTGGMVGSAQSLMSPYAMGMS